MAIGINDAVEMGSQPAQSQGDTASRVAFNKPPGLYVNGDVDESILTTNIRLRTGEIDEAVSAPLFPPIPTHFSRVTEYFYRFTSSILSFIFLIFIVLLGS